MKKLYFLATAAVFVLASCTKSESLDDLLGLEISFDAFSGNATKVGFATGKITDSDFEFASVAYYTAEKDAWKDEASKVAPDWGGNGFLGTQWLKFTDIKAVTENNEIVSFKSESSKAYWPRQGYLNFFSWYPSDVDAEMSKGALMIEDYVIEDAANVDLMVADPALGLFRTHNDAKYTPTDADYSGVKTLFRHKLTKIGVQAKIKNLGESNLESFTVTVKEVKINNVCNKGTFQGSLDNNYLGAWTVDATTDATYSFPMPNDGIDVVYPYTTASPYYKSVVDDEIMLLPQTRIEMGDDAILKLTCDLKYTIKGSSEVITEQDHVYQTTISDSQQQGGPEYLDWGINKYIIYRLVFGLDEIEWAPVVEDWETEHVEPIYVE